jgi:hypothetical protein
MSEEGQEWKEALMRPSSTLSAGFFIVGVWMAFLTIINIAVGAYSNGRKVNWIDFITNGENTNSTHEIALAFPDDILFGLLSSLLIGAGIRGMGAAREDGFGGWFSGLPQDQMLTSLFSTKNGMGRTIASWMILSGAGYYLVWSAIESTWVDPGVYSVMISFVMVGLGLNLIQDATAEN